MLASRKLVMVGSSLTALLLAACSDSAVAPSGNDMVGGAAFARNGSVSPNPDKNQSCAQDGGTRKSQSKEKNQCSGPTVTWTVTTAGMDGTDYVNVCYPRNISNDASKTWATAPQICYPNDPDFKGQITSDGSPTFTFVLPDASTIYFVATPFSSGTSGSPNTGGSLGSDAGVGLSTGECLTNGPGNWGYCTVDATTLTGVMSYSFSPPQTWRVLLTIANSITGDRINVCGPRSGSESSVCRVTDTDYKGFVSNADPYAPSGGSPNFYYRDFLVSVTDAKPYIVATPFALGMTDPGVGVGGQYGTFTSSCVNGNTGIGEYYILRCSAANPPAVTNTIWYKFAPRS